MGTGTQRQPPGTREQWSEGPGVTPGTVTPRSPFLYLVPPRPPGKLASLSHSG